MKPERWGSPLVQEKYQEEKACDRRRTYRIIIIIIMTSPDGTTHNQIDHVLIDMRWHSSVLDVQSFKGADCDTDHYLMTAKVRKRLAVGK